MTTVVPFRTRARTIDHLGREQIADCPTAVSELWKNAYDAYATSVELHIFDGDPCVAAVVDDGHGMSRDEFIRRWLVVGTEAKIEEQDANEEDRNGLPPRPRQGQKGIGRLSIAALGPVTLVLSKRQGMPFMASLIDWRLFENPYLNLEDIFLPVEELSERSEKSFHRVLAGMLDALVDNVWGKKGTPDRNHRVNEAWQKYDLFGPRAEGKTPSEQIVDSAIAAWITHRHLNVWSVWRDAANEHGTALFVLKANHELAIWTSPSDSDEQIQPEAKEVKDRLQETLSGFTDALSASKLRFRYHALVHRGLTESFIVEYDEQFDLEQFHELEHFLEGEFDQYGMFHGVIRAFGREPVQMRLAPRPMPPQKGIGFVGPFKLCIGTFEIDPAASTHSPDQHQYLKEQAEKYSGMAMYRDGIRVMPYGRADVDFFEIEERRSRNAGREFWSDRRSFGRVAITRNENPHLRDKAGREGLVDNQARRELKFLVVGLLKHTARTYLGSDSTLRDEYLPEIKAKNEAAKAAEEKASKRRIGAFRDALRRQSGPLDEAIQQVRAATVEVKRVADSGMADGFFAIEDRLNELLARKAALRLPPKPARMGKLEDLYRQYRDRYNELCIAIDELKQHWYAATEQFIPSQPEDRANSALGRHQKYLTDEVTNWEKHIQTLLDVERENLERQAHDDRARYHQDAAPLLTELIDGRMDLTTVLNRFEEIRERLHQEFMIRYGSYQRTLEQLADDIDVDAALLWSSEERAQLEKSVEQLHALAQLGITVEIINHELHYLDSEVRSNLKRLPKDVQTLEPYRMALHAHKALVDRLRFLSPIKLSGPRLREEMTGGKIFAYLRDFFATRIEARRVHFYATNAFNAIRLVEYPARIHPVFVNLVNNALYWVSLDREGKDREICLDLIGNDVVVADSGPGVDLDDMAHLFELFFTRKVEGRGVGLYLCRANLKMGDHTIEYSVEPRHRILKGANFVIKFRGLKHG